MSRPGFMLLKIDNSKGASMNYRGSKWSDPGAALYDQLLQASYIADLKENDVQKAATDPRNKGWKDFLKETYLIAPVNDIKNTPHGITPYSQSGCKYPHHIIHDGKLVMHRGGVLQSCKQAIRAREYKGNVKSHLERHLEEFGLKVQFHHGQVYFGESTLHSSSNPDSLIQERIDNNFDDIEDYIAESNKKNDDQRSDFSIVKLPAHIRKKIIETNKKIISVLKEKIKEEKYKDLNKPEIIQELVKVMSTGKFVGHTYLTKRPRSAEGWIFITDADQVYKFYQGNPTESLDHALYKKHYKLLQDIEKDLKSEYTDPDFKFILRGDPPDMIHQFEFILSNEIANELWISIHDKYGKSITENSWATDDKVISNKHWNSQRWNKKKDNEDTIMQKHRSSTSVKESFRESMNLVKESMTEIASYIGESGRIMDDNLDWIEKYLTEEAPPAPSLDDDEPEQQTPVQQPKPESIPKQRDREETDKNGVRRKKLYIAFIEWCKEYNQKNTFGSVFDKDAFNISYPFVPQEMRYFYRLANPMLCVLAGDLTFFALAELRKLNVKNSRINEMMIFAATKEDVRVFNSKDKKIYRGVEENGMLKLDTTKVLGNTFDTYLQNMINRGDILNAPLDNNSESPHPPIS